MPDVHLLGRYRARVALRRRPGFELKPEWEALDGREVEVQGGWLMGERDQYPGEWAMVFIVDEQRITWIASGDLADLREM